MPSTTTLLAIAAAAGWLLVLVVLLVLSMLTRRWKAAFNEREWTLVPTLSVSAIQRSMDSTASSSARLEDAVLTAAEDARATREAFEILGRELDARTDEVKRLRMGEGFHHRRPALLAAIRALEAIAIDQAAGSAPEMTLRGIEIDLRETLEDNGIEILLPSVGERIPTRGVDAGSARHLPSSDPALVGTIAAVDRPAYIARGSGGDDEVLKPATVAIYVTEEEHAEQ